MNFIETIKERARQEIKTIVLPEAEDIRTLKATEKILKEEKQDLLDEYNKDIEAINNQLILLYNQEYYVGSYSDYQQEYNNINKEIARLERQIAVTEGDTSDENRKNLRELRSKLQNAQNESDKLLTLWTNRMLIDSFKEDKITIYNNYNTKLDEIERIHNQNISDIQSQN